MSHQAPMQGAQTIHTIVCAFSYLDVPGRVVGLPFLRGGRRKNVTNKVGLWSIERKGGGAKHDKTGFTVRCKT